MSSKYKCKHCDEQFRDLGPFLQHCKTCVKNPKSRITECKKCGKELKRGIEMIRHYETVHPK